MKKLLSIILSILMVVTMIPMAVMPAGATGAQAQVNDNFKVEITRLVYTDSSGKTYDYTDTFNSWALYDLALTNVSDGKCKLQYTAALLGGNGGTGWDNDSVTLEGVSCDSAYTMSFEKFKINSTEEWKYTIQISKTVGHAYGDLSYIDDEKHGRICAINTAHTIDDEHSYNNGYCDYCDAYQSAELNENGYYEIGNAGQLFWYANYINTVDRTANAVLTADIDLENRPWTPIGSTGENSNNFRGIFDGQNHTIEGLYVEGDRAGLGFFGEVRTGTVKNFTIYGEVVVNTEVDYIGGVIGSVCGVNGENDLERNGAIIQNIKSYVNLTAKAHGIGKIGGFVGYANHQSLIENCSWYGTFDAGKYRVDNGAGGFIGRIQENTSEVTIRNCAAFGTIKTNYAGDYNNTATIYMGGFLSFTNTNAKTTLENCLFAGKFERGANLTDEAFLGAFGTLRSVNAIKNCYYLGYDGLEAVHSDSNLKPGSDNVEITKVTEEQLKSGEIAYKLQGEQTEHVWGQNIGTDSFPVIGGEKVYYGCISCVDEVMVYTNDIRASDNDSNHAWGEGVLTRPTKTQDGYYTYTCSACGETKTEPVLRAANYEDYEKALEDLRAYLDSDMLTDENKGYISQWLATYDTDEVFCFIAGEEATVQEYIDATAYYASEIEAAIEDCLAGNHSGNGETCEICGTTIKFATVTDGTNTYYAADADTLNKAVTAILETGSRTFTVELPADTEAEMITAIRRAICDTEGVADGSINLTLKGVTSIPGTTNWDGVAFGPGDIYDEAGEIVDQELVTQLASVNLPDATEIGAQAFYFCENLVSVSAPKAQTIGAQAFGYTALTSVEFPELTTIPTDMFSGTWTLSSAKFPKVTTIEQGGLLIGAKFNPENNPTPFPLELTAEGDITFNGSYHFNIASRNYSGKVDLVLNIDKKDQVTFNDDGTATWQVRDDLSYTFKSITFTCTDGTTNHSYTYTDNGDGTHDKVCLVCDYVEVDNEAHTGGTATCKEQAKCEHCGASYGEFDWTNHEGEYVTVWFNDYQHVSEYECCHIESSVVYEDHKYENYTVITPADCVNNAWEMGECICGDIHIREIAGSAKNHDWSDKNGICTNCGEECPHEWDEGVLTRPVYDAVLGSKDGYYTYTCTVCGKEKKETVKSADYSAYEAASEEINALLQSDELTNAAKQAIYSAANECGLLSNDLMESEQNIVDDLVAELEKIIADADEKIASGEYVKIDGMKEYNKIADALDAELMENYSQEEIAALAEKAGDEINARFGEIIEKAEALTGTVAENKDALAEIESELSALYAEMKNCLDGVHNGLVYEVTEEAKCEVNAIESATCTLCGETDEREIEGTALEHEPNEQMCKGYWCSRCRSFYGEGNPDIHLDGYSSTGKIKDGQCDGCNKQLAFIKSGETYEINSYAYVVEFAPVVDGRYILTVDGPEGTEIDVREVVDGVNKGINCEVISDLVYVVDCTVGKIYRFEASNYYGYNISSMTLECETHKGTVQTCYGYICDACGEYFGEVPGHDIIIDEAVPPTCTQTGLTEGQHCSRCDDMTIIQEKVPATNHKDTLVKVDAKAATCTEAGWEAYEYCTACDYTTYKEISATKHTEETVKGYDATCTATGLTDGVKCSVCGETLTARQSIAQLAHKDSDGDYKCDYGCGHEFEKPADPDQPDTPEEPEQPEDPSENCDHLCHKDGILGFFWKIIRFFQKLFRINQYCECGKAHW